MSLARLITLETHKDKRGSFTELFKQESVKQVSFSVSLPGITRSWHKHKNQTDYMCVIKGRVKICVSDEKKLEEYILWGEKLQILQILPNIWHGTKNIGKVSSYILYGVTNFYNCQNPDEERKKEIKIKGKSYVW